MRHVVLALLLPALLLLAPLAAAEPRAESRSYYGSVVTQCARGVQPLDIGSTCFSLRADDAGRPLALTMRDHVLGDVSAAYWIQQGGAVLTRGAFCGATETTVPQGATLVIVFHSSAPQQSLACPAPLSGAGTITMTVG